MSAESFVGEMMVALFPLPNAVLFPRAVLPLHIFEERFRRMTADALVAQRQIAMALLKPGWERDYYSAPEIEPVVCVGRIVNSEMLADGRYNLLLQGEMRARVETETQRRPYRIARVSPVPEKPAAEIDLEKFRRRLTAMIGPGAMSETVLGRHFQKIVLSDLGMAEIADLLAFNFLEDVQVKQSLLAEGDVAQRVARVVEAIEAMLPRLPAQGATGNETIGLN